ncbi:MAG: tetratricopeptide repeat protein [Gammaproteobacteria bacterium]|nr:tetratricopeptide repeat protein [Gammaproteobacteria bacterium]
MSDQDILIFEVSQSNFNTSVIFNSHKVPVLVEFLGVWSEPCIHLEERLSAAAKEFAGQFVYAKVDMDEQAELIKEYKIENVPTTKVFKDGEVVRTEEGLLSEAEIRALLKDFGVFRESDELREQARAKHIAGETVEAMQLLTKAIQMDPRNTRVAMDMVQVFLDIGELEQARSLYERLPESDRQSETGRTLTGQITFQELAAKTKGKLALQDKLATNPDDNDARFDLAVCLVAEHDYPQAMDNLFMIFDKEPEYKEGAAREMIINLTNMLAPNDPQLAQEFRRRLGNTLA